MRFCDKLPKLRKEINFSQEQLADRLGVSRQAVSKWESGSSYPDMDKLIQICSILNCTLEDLMDDGAIGGNKNNSSINKFNISNWLNDFLKYITNTYNMFCSMSFKNKVKCLLEMGFIGLILFFIGMIVYHLVDDLILDLFLNLPKFGEYIYILLSNILMIGLLIAGIIVFLHLFKIRYLDYFITIEDKNVVEKTVEEPVDEKLKYSGNRKQERIIIRDPKHASFSFFDGLAKIIVFFIKLFVIFFGSFFIVSFIGLIFSSAVLIDLLKYGVVFFGILVSCVGALAINYLIIEFIYNFIFNNKQHIKRIFIIFISGLVLFGIGIGVSFISTLDFKYRDNNNDLEYVTDTRYFDFNVNTRLYDYDNIIIDNSLKNIKVEITHLKDFSYNDSFDTYYNELYFYGSDENIIPSIKIILNDIKKKELRDYDDLMDIDVKLYVSKKNYDLLIKNNNSIKS